MDLQKIVDILQQDTGYASSSGKDSFFPFSLMEFVWQTLDDKSIKRLTKKYREEKFMEAGAFEEKLQELSLSILGLNGKEVITAFCPGDLKKYVGKSFYNKPFVGSNHIHFLSMIMNQMSDTLYVDNDAIKSTGARILEIGAGANHNMRNYLTEMGFDVFGLELGGHGYLPLDDERRGNAACYGFEPFEGTIIGDWVEIDSHFQPESFDVVYVHQMNPFDNYENEGVNIWQLEACELKGQSMLLERTMSVIKPGGAFYNVLCGSCNCTFDQRAVSPLYVDGYMQHDRLQIFSKAREDSKKS